MQEMKKWWKKVRIWEEVTLRQWFCLNAKNAHYKADFWLPLLKIWDLINNTETLFVKENIPEQFKVNENDIIYSRTWQVWLVFKWKKWVIYNNCFKIIPSKNLDNNYLYWFLKSEDIIQLAKSLATWAAQPDLNHDAFKSIEITFPENIQTQQKIASILSKYDDLIENNNKRIKILEETAQSIYEEWFVKYNFPWSENIKMIDSENDDFGMIPEGWEVKKVWDIINIQKWKNITKATVKEWIVPVVAWWLNPSCYHSIWNTTWPVITISASWANAWYVNFYYEDIWASDCSYIDWKVTNFVYFWYLQLINRQVEITWLQRWSAQPHVYPKDIMWLFSLDIPENLLNDFEKIVSKIFMEVWNIKKQNENLKETRDLLIPRLVSGELDVENLDVK